MTDYQALYTHLTRRYAGITPEALQKILCPVLVPIRSIDPQVVKSRGQSHWHASFEIEIAPEYEELMTVGRTGKFVPGSYASGGIWRELAKGRIVGVCPGTGIAQGEIYLGTGSRQDLQRALAALSTSDFLEIDQYGASAKILSGLVEHNLSELVRRAGYRVRRMPEDCAKHLGMYYNYDFEFEKDHVVKKVEVKSLWGTDTRCARLIHSKSKSHKTSSCKFQTQDIFAVSLFLRTGSTQDFAFAKSVSLADDPVHGLPHARGYADYVHQNPLCQIDNVTWFDHIDKVWAV